MNATEKFSIKYTRFIDPEGRLLKDAPEFAYNLCDFIPLYQQMLLTRFFDYKAVYLQKIGQLNTYASILGQEAVSVGIGASMRIDDVFCPFYRDYGAQLMRGVRMDEILSFWRGNEWGNYYRGIESDFPICIPIGTQLLHAAGVAMAFKVRSQSKVVVTTCGDGATSEGDFYEALNIAGVWQLPIIFVINNNQWAISMPRTLQSQAGTLAQKAIAAGIDGEQVDGNDLIAVKFVLEKAIKKAREGGGPSVIEALTYRLCNHTTADDATRYRSTDELKNAWKEEPLVRLKKYLIDCGYWSDEEEEKFKKECCARIEAAVAQYLSHSEPAISDMFNFHYAEIPQDLIEQRIEAEAVFELSREGDLCSAKD